MMSNDLDEQHETLRSLAAQLGLLGSLGDREHSRMVVRTLRWVSRHPLRSAGQCKRIA